MLNKNNLIWILLLIVLLPGLLGIFHPGLFISDDAHWMVIRMSGFYSGLVSGQFPTRFLPQLNNGYGYPVADFLYPLFLYIGSILHIFKIPILLSIKIIFAGSFILSAFATFLWLRKFFDKISSLSGAIIYAYFPYHLYDLYQRGSIGEMLALSILPLIFLFVENQNFIATTVSIALLITSHNTLAILFLPIVIIYMYIKKTNVINILLQVVIGLGLASFFWIPALFDRQYTVFNSTVVANPSNYFINFSNAGLIGLIGIVSIIAIIFVRNFWEKKLVILFLLVSLFGIFMSIPVSYFLWGSTLRQFVQFPFRFLSIVIVATSFLGAFIVNSVEKKKYLITGIGLIIVVLSLFNYIFPKNYDLSPESFYLTNQDTTTVQNEYMPIWVHKRLDFNPSKINVIGDGRIESFSLKGTTINAILNINKRSTIQIGFVYFPGWRVTVDNKEINIRPSSTTGLIEFSVPNGIYEIKVEFIETPIHIFADLISIISTLILILFYFKSKYAKQI